jgi:hypothetical protein
VQSTLGIEREAPDEFRVVSRPPLSVPPQFNLRPPSVTGEPSPTNIPTDQQARSLVTGSETFSLKENTAAPAAKKALPGTTLNNAESLLLKNAGAESSDPTVRTTLVEERIAVQEKKEESSWWDFTSWKSDPKDPMVKAKEEAERIKKNQEAGKPVTEGETPQTKGKDRGILGHILGD